MNLEREGGRDKGLGGIVGGFSFFFIHFISLNTFMYIYVYIYIYIYIICMKLHENYVCICICVRICMGFIFVSIFRHCV